MSFARIVRTGGRAFTLVEMLISVALIGVLATIVGTLYVHAKARSRALRCLYNQQQIASALISFYSEKGTFPSDDPTNDLAIQLSDYIVWPKALHGEALPAVYNCPNDRAGKISNSYQPFYVRRREPSGADYFVLGCPRHAEVEDGYVNLFGVHMAARSKPGLITINDKEVSAELPSEARTIASGSMKFEDGSSVTVTSTSLGYGITAVASFRHQDGRLYTIVRVAGKGEAKFSVTPGSRFEVVTPAALIGVEGTQFTVRTDQEYAKIHLTQGAVRVWDKIKNAMHAMRVVTVAQTLEVGKPPASNLSELCIRCIHHCTKNGVHCDRCPLHVGLPQNIGTNLCVCCPKHCVPNKSHCPFFCPLGLKIKK